MTEQAAEEAVDAFMTMLAAYTERVQQLTWEQGFSAGVRFGEGAPTREENPYGTAVWEPIPSHSAAPHVHSEETGS